ncbi:hypothetical protein BOTBODRAFT_35721 [Botryobasidium botryosum FD-172 SS1]|uniref:FHA domain-containing protein n=1 Tax=Botryobasidium botryosum (strain FD-172 SS1) TaxID=930990 RepID=A0A067M599_BOTB1|nr:hypothetical protein BOTBODRAFT_35721 [Botryobasidium botryosum FD-172 SS1]
MPTPNPSPFPLAHHPQMQHQPPALPALFLLPLNDSFIPKQISLAPGVGRVKIGRQTNAKTVPGERNGYFDSKVLSRQHAEVWEEGGKIYIKDVKSSNGTFINGDRLSSEGIESDPFELKSDDVVEFGIDIVGEDNKTVIHHKVAARVICVITPDDLASLPPPAHMHPRQGPGGSFATTRPPHPAQSPTALLGGMGGGGIGGRVGKSGLTFDHILSRLQGELQKSRETGSELNGLANVMTDIHDTLGGGGPPPLPPYPHVLPPVRPPTEAHLAALPSSNSVIDSATLTTLQNQLRDAQSSLATQAEKLRNMDDFLKEHESIKREVASMRELMLERKSEVEERSRNRKNEVVDDDDDDARSISTVMPERDDEETEAERRARREDFGRPRTPEPTGHGLDEEDEERMRLHDPHILNGTAQPLDQSHSLLTVPRSSPPPDWTSQTAALTARLDALTAQLDAAVVLSQTLQAEASAAQTTIALLETKVSTLEALVAEQKLEWEHQRSRTGAGLSVLEEWRARVEVEWKNERESWEEERLRLKDAMKEWERRMADMEKREQEKIEAERLEQRDEDVFHGANGRDMLHGGMNGDASSPSSSPRSIKSRRRRSSSPISTENGSNSPSTSPSSPYPTTPPPGETTHMNGKPPALSFSELTPVEEDADDEEIHAPLINGHHAVQRKGTMSMGDNPLPYLSAAGVVVIGIAAWTVVHRVKD